MFLKIEPILLAVTFEKWRTAHYKTLRGGAGHNSIQAIVKNFTRGIEVGYHQMRLYSSYPVDLQKGVIVSPSDIHKTVFWRVTNNMPVEIDLRASGKASLKMLERLIAKPEKPKKQIPLHPCERDMEVFRLHTQEKISTNILAEQYGLSQIRIRTICTDVRKYQDSIASN